MCDANEYFEDRQNLLSVMTERYAGRKKLGLLDQRNNWNIPVGLDSSGRREYKIHMTSCEPGIPLKLQEMLNQQIIKYHSVDDGGGGTYPITQMIQGDKELVDKIKPAILAAAYITDINLICINNRIETNRRVRDVKKVILQSEAIAIFKGNFIRTLKQIFDGSEINRIKRALTFSLGLDSVLPIINRAYCEYLQIKDYTPAWEARIIRITQKAFNDLDISDFEKEGYKAIENSPKLEKPNAPKEIKEVSDISLDSIRQIKF